MCVQIVINIANVVQGLRTLNALPVSLGIFLYQNKVSAMWNAPPQDGMQIWQPTIAEDVTLVALTALDQQITSVLHARPTPT